MGRSVLFTGLSVLCLNGCLWVTSHRAKSPRLLHTKAMGRYRGKAHRDELLAKKTLMLRLQIGTYRPPYPCLAEEIAGLAAAAAFSAARQAKAAAEAAFSAARCAKAAAEAAAAEGRAVAAAAAAAAVAAACSVHSVHDARQPEYGLGPGGKPGCRAMLAKKGRTIGLQQIRSYSVSYPSPDEEAAGSEAAAARSAARRTAAEAHAASEAQAAAEGQPSAADASPRAGAVPDGI